MKRCLLSALLVSATVTVAAEPTPAELVERARENPFILFTREQVKGIRGKIASDPDARAWWREFSDKAAKHLKNPPEVPDRGGQWILWYNCRKCGVPLKTEDAHHHVCPSCGEMHVGHPYDDCFIMRRHYRLGEAVRECGIAYALTGERGYADWIRSVMLGYAKAYAGYRWHTRNGLSDGPGGDAARLASQVLDEAFCLIHLLEGYDVIRNELTVEDRERIAEGFIRPSVETILTENSRLCNHESWHLAAYGLSGLVIGDESLVDRALNSEYGSRNQLANGIMSDGCWWELAMHYHLYTIDALVSFYRPLVNLGCTPPERIREMLYAAIGQIGPDGFFVAGNDSWARSFAPGDGSKYFEIAYSWWGDDVFGWWVNQKSRQNENYTLWGRNGHPEAKLAFTSRRYDAAGLAIMRTRTPGFSGKTVGGMPDNCLMLDYGPHGKWHGHPDKLHLTFWAHGVLMAEDAGCMDYGNPRHWGWYKSTLAHNTIRIDGLNQKPATGRLLGWVEKDNAVAVAADAGRIADGVTARRMSALVDDILLDYLWVESETEHQYEWIFHGQGKLATSVTTDPVHGIPPHVTKLEKHGDWSGEDSWSWVEDPRKGVHEGMWTATWVGEGKPTMQLVQKSPAGEVWTGVGGALTPPRKVPFVVNRLRGKAVAFPAVITCGNAEVMIGKTIAEADGTVGFAATVNGRRFLLLYNSLGICRVGDCVWQEGLVLVEVGR